MADFTALKTAIQNAIKQNGNEEITGNILQGILLSIVTTLGDSAINDLITALGNEVNARQQADGTLQQNITDEATARGNADTALSNRLGSTITSENTAADQIGAEAEARAAADTALQRLIDGITDNIENGYVYVGIATPSSTPATGKVFYLALTAGTYTNFDNAEVSQGINILKYNGSAWVLDTFIGIDDEPTVDSDNLVKSGGVFEQTNFYEKTLERSISGSGAESFVVGFSAGEIGLFDNTGNSDVTIKLYGPTSSTFQAELSVPAKTKVFHTYAEDSIAIRVIPTTTYSVDIYKYKVDSVKNRISKNTTILEENLIIKATAIGTVVPFTNDIATVEEIDGIMRKDGTIDHPTLFKTYKITATFNDATSKKGITFIPKYVDNNFLQVAIFRNNKLFYGTGTLVAGECYTVWLRKNDTIYLYATEISHSSGLLLNTYIQPLSGKKVVTYGDSLVKNGGWQDVIAELTDATVINSGVGGSTLAYREREQYVNADGYEVGDPQQGYQPQPGDTLINDTGSGSQRLSFIASDANVVLILFGTNDFHQNKAIGTFNDSDNTTFKGAIKATIQWIRTNRPLCRIIFLTPTTERTEETNQLGLKKIDYIKAIIEAGVEMNIDVINLWSLTSWGTQNYSNYSIDAIHWNNLGKEIIGTIISKQLLGRF